MAINYRRAAQGFKGPDQFPFSSPESPKQSMDDSAQQTTESVVDRLERVANDLYARR